MSPTLSSAIELLRASGVPLEHLGGAGAETAQDLRHALRSQLEQREQYLSQQQTQLLRLHQLEVFASWASMSVVLVTGLLAVVWREWTPALVGSIAFVFARAMERLVVGRAISIREVIERMLPQWRAIYAVLVADDVLRSEGSQVGPAEGGGDSKSALTLGSERETRRELVLKSAIEALTQPPVE